MVTGLILYAVIGGIVGAALGYCGKCASGTCPLTATWWRGAIYGAVLGGALYFLAGGGSSASTAAMNASTANVARIGENQFDAEVTHSPSPVVVDFYATWCGPCKILSPMLDRMAGSFTNEIKFVKINVDEAPALSQRFNIQGIPTLLFFKDGQVTDRILGVPETGDLKARLELLAETNAPVKI